MMNHLAIGQSELQITPPLGVSIAGYYYDRKADGIYQELFARALVLSSGGVLAAIVVCDLIGLDRTDAQVIRQEIQRRCGIPANHILIACTHTHTGPATTPWAECGIYPDEAYLSFLRRRIADAAVLAAANLRPASAWVAHGSVSGIAFNRRYWMKDGSLRTNPPFQSPLIGQPAGPVDPDLGLVVFRDPQAFPLALLTNYALHPDQVSGTALGADYEGVMVDLLKGALGQRLAVLCTNGCAGDINHYDMSRPGPQYGIACAERSGRALAGEVIRRLSDLTESSHALLQAKNCLLSLPLRTPTPTEVAWARQIAGQELVVFDQRGLDIVTADRIMGLHQRGVTHVSAEISVITLGDIAWVGLPGEIFAQLGLEIKRHSPFTHTFPIELCNDSIGYLPPRQVYTEGGYEAASSPFAPGDGEIVVEAVISLLQRLHLSSLKASETAASQGKEDETGEPDHK